MAVLAAHGHMVRAELLMKGQRIADGNSQVRLPNIRQKFLAMFVVNPTSTEGY